MLTLAERFTWVFAVNNPKLDANATRIQSTAGPAANLCNFGLHTDGKAASLTLGYCLTTGEF